MMVYINVGFSNLSDVPKKDVMKCHRHRELFIICSNKGEKWYG
jgi:hypothetical protein